MTVYSKVQRARIVEAYFKHNGSLIAVQRDFSREFKQKSPSKHCIIATIAKFRETGGTADKKRSGRPRSARNEDAVEVVSISVAENPNTSTRKRSSQLEISRTTLQRIMKKDLRLYPYKIQVTQLLKSADRQKRMDFARQFLSLNNCESFISHLIMSDEAHFHLDGYGNKQNYRFWSTESPRNIHEKPRKSRFGVA